MRKTIAIILTGVAVSALGGCGGGSDGGTPPVVVPPTPTPTPTPIPTPTPTPVSACASGLTDGGVVNGRQICDLPATVSANLTLKRTTGTVYRLPGSVFVGGECGYDPAVPYATCAPAVLTIEPGVTVLAKSNASLIVRRGSQIKAVGSATAPIVFTSETQLTGTVDDNSKGQWYGIGLLGRAYIADCWGSNAYNPRCDEPVYEPAYGFTDDVRYGGATDNESAGELRYVQIRFSKRGLFAGGTGGQTVIDHVQVHNSTTYSVTAFGGRANFQYLALTGGSGIRPDHGHRGIFSHVVSVQGPYGFQSMPGASYNDDFTAAQIDIRYREMNGDNFRVPRTYTRISNATFVKTRATGAGGPLFSMEGGADVAMLNSVMVTPEACLRVVNTEGLGPPNAASHVRDLGPPIFRSVVMQCGTAFVNSPDAWGGVFVPVANIAAAFKSGQFFNNANFISSLVTLFVNGANETAVTPTSLSTPDYSIYDDPYADPITGAPLPNANPTFIGAIRDANDTSFQGWTCNAGYFSFGGSGGSCNALPPA